MNKKQCFDYSMHKRRLCITKRVTFRLKNIFYKKKYFIKVINLNRGYSITKYIPKKTFYFSQTKNSCFQYKK